MTQPLAGNRPAQAAIAALALLGAIGAALALAHGGFESSPKRGGAPTFVPLAQAWLFVAAMHAMSLLALLALVRLRHRSAAAMVLTVAAHAALVAGAGWLMGWR
jgi:cytochrome bd-type quinol oxidase subunit 2